MISILRAFDCVPDCPICLGSGAVCEAHPSRAWGDGLPMIRIGKRETWTMPGGAIICYCGAAGMPCKNIAKN